jgi:hypothetical protein
LCYAIADLFLLYSTAEEITSKKIAHDFRLHSIGLIAASKRA